MTVYWLAEHVHVCRTNEGAVFVDLERNKYFGVGLEESIALGDLVVHWPPHPTDSELPQMAPNVTMQNDVAGSLEAAGLLATAPPLRSGLNSTTIDLDGTLTSVGEELIADINVTAKHVLMFVRACVYAAVSLHFRRLSNTTRSVSERKARGTAALGPEQLARVIYLVQVFRSVRPYVFRAKDRCLFHALALTRFLSYFGVSATWVLGVKVTPWAAHSWVQMGTLILDTNPDRVCEYTPIVSF